MTIALVVAKDDRVKIGMDLLQDFALKQKVAIPILKASKSYMFKKDLNLRMLLNKEQRNNLISW